MTYDPIPKTTIDLTCMDRFDAGTGTLQINIGKQRITLTGFDERLAGETFALYAGKPGRNPHLLIAVKADPHGYPSVSSGGKNPARRLSGTSKYISLLAERGVELPQTTDLNWDDFNSAFTAKLQLAISEETPVSQRHELRYAKQKKEAIQA